MKKNKKIIIIGAGISGLTAGINLLKKGYKVEIYEKNTVAGGCCSGWERNSYYIDNCMHWLTGTNQHTKLFKKWKVIGALSENSNLYQEEYFYKTHLGNKSVSLYYDLEKTRKEMYELAINNSRIIDKKEIDAFINVIKQVKNLSLNTKIYKKIKGYINPLIKYKKLSLNELSNKFKTPILKKLFTDYFPKEYSSLAIIYSYAAFCSGNGKIYLEGSQKFSQNILNNYLSLGGKIYYNENIIKINASDKKAYSITTDKNKTFYGDIFISTCSFNYTYNNLLNEKLPQTYQNKVSNKKDYPIFSSFQGAFIIKSKKKIIKDTEIIEIPKTKIGTNYYERIILKEYSYLNKEKEGILYEIMTMQTENDYDYWEKLPKEIYNKEKESIVLEIINHLSNKYPEVKGLIEYLDSWTPLTYNKYYNLYKGSYMAFAFTKHSSIRKLPFETPFKNVYTCTIWQDYTGGLPMALKLGYKVASKI